MTRSLRLLSGLVLVVATAWPTLAAWPPEGLEGELDLPVVTDGGVEVRVWLGGGVATPSELYRIFETPTGVSGGVILWEEVSHASDGGLSARQARRETARLRRLLARHRCAGNVNRTENYLWCVGPLREDVNWEVLLQDLMVERLWDLPEELARDCGWVEADGEIVGIELVQGERRHLVAYGNPEFCCTDIACAIANHVRQVVRHAM